MTTPDFRALCAELADDLELLFAYGGIHPSQESDDLIDRARAALSEPEPPADGEVAELVAWLRRHADIQEAAGTHWAQQFTRAADLLERLAPHPVPEEPSDAELDALLQAIFAQRLYQGNIRTTLEVDFARAVLARWGRAPTLPLKPQEPE